MTRLEYICTLLLLLSLLSGCGRKGALMPPEALVPAAVQDFKVQQSGDEFRLTWSAPAKEKGGRPLRDLSGFRIFKRILAGDGTDCSSCPDAWTLFAGVDAADPGEKGSSGATFIRYDKSSPGDRSSQYRLLAVSKSGGISAPALSPLLRLRAPLPAPALKGTVLPSSIKLEFAFDPVVKHRPTGFNIYRRADKSPPPLLPFNQLPVRESAWEDMQVEYGRSYSYSVTALVEIDGESVESLRSEEINLVFSLQDLR